MMMMRNLRPNHPTVINIYLGTSQQSPAPNYLRPGQTNGEINSHYIGEIKDQHTENIIERKTLFLTKMHI
jgi:hypothetical protein